MVEIYRDSTWVAAHERFARDQREIEAFRRQFHIPPSGERLIAAQTKVLDFVPKYPAISLLLGSHERKSWARFAIPDNYYSQRAFGSYIAPSLGPPEKQEADVRKIENFIRQQTKRVVFDLSKKDRDKEKGRDPEEELIDEGSALVQLLEKGVKETNLMINFVITRMYQFVPA